MMTNAEAFVLAIIRQRESANVYNAPPVNPPYSTASGAYQFIRATWVFASRNTGAGIMFADAYLAPPEDQDTNALWLLRKYGANSSHAWKASGPYPSIFDINVGLAAIRVS